MTSRSHSACKHEIYCIFASERTNDSAQGGLLQKLSDYSALSTVVFPRLLYWAVASSVGPAAVYYSSDLIWLTDDRATLKSLLSAGLGRGSGGGGGCSGWLQTGRAMLNSCRWQLSGK